MARNLRALAPVAIAAALALASCGGRVTEPPWGLDTVRLPSDDASVVAVLGALPDQVGGRQRAPSYDPHRVEYLGAKTRSVVRAMHLGQAAVAEGFPATAGGFIQGLVDGDEVQIEASEVDPDAELVYFVGAIGGSRDSPDEYVVAWGEPDSEWMFTANSDSPDGRLALVEAFVDAVRSRM